MSQSFGWERVVVLVMRVLLVVLARVGSVHRLVLIGAPRNLNARFACIKKISLNLNSITSSSLCACSSVFTRRIEGPQTGRVKSSSVVLI